MIIIVQLLYSTGVYYCYNMHTALLNQPVYIMTSRIIITNRSCYGTLNYLKTHDLAVADSETRIPNVNIKLKTTLTVPGIDRNDLYYYNNNIIHEMT
jgi:hypothetical protein